jgi:hypothetical protein
MQPSSTKQYVYEYSGKITPDEYKTYGNLGDFNNNTINGNWTLHIINHSIATGSLASFSIKFSYN